MAFKITKDSEIDTRRKQDQELVRRMLRGEESAYRECVDLYKDRLYACMLAHTGSQHDAEEIVQESFFKVFLHLPSFQHQSRLYTWIYRIAWNTSISRTRKGRDEISLESSGIDTNPFASESSHPHTTIERLERVAMLRSALSAIENRHQRILMLREFEERSYQEIAELLAIPLGTVRSRLARARDRLREELIRIDEEQGLGQSDPPESGAPELADV